MLIILQRASSVVLQGRFVTDGLDAEGIKTKFVAVDQDTRINVKIKADQETEINGGGPVINEYQLAESEASSFKCKC